jgi:hypothetical protein
LRALFLIAIVAMLKKGEYIMDRKEDRSADLIELGAVSVETQGAIGKNDDHAGLVQQTGLSQD